MSQYRGQVIKEETIGNFSGGAAQNRIKQYKTEVKGRTLIAGSKEELHTKIDETLGSETDEPPATQL